MRSGHRNVTEQFWTFPYMPGKKKTGKTVFVLTSRRTFSAAEQFSYDLKSLERTNWESTGVETDVEVPAADALEEALKRARNGQ